MASTESPEKDEQASEQLQGPTPAIITIICPPGLEYLMDTYRITIEQIVHWTEVMKTVPACNKYHIIDHLGRRMYFAAEMPTASTSMKGAIRPWNISLFDNAGMLVLNGFRRNDTRNLNNLVAVTLPNMLMIGGIIQVTTNGKAAWAITNMEGYPILGLGSPPNNSLNPGATSVAGDFYLYSLTLTNGEYTVLGKISKALEGVFRETNRNTEVESDQFVVEFPMELDPRMKAVLVYAAFLINFIFYENTMKHNIDRYL